MSDVVVVLDIGGTTLRAARLYGNRVDRVVLCHTPTHMVFPDRPLERLQNELVDLAADLTLSVTRELAEPERRHIRIAVSISGQVAADRRTVVSAPDIWGDGDIAFPLAQAIEQRLMANTEAPQSSEVLVCNDVVASAAAWANKHEGDDAFALLMVRSGLSYIVGDKSSLTGTVLLGHLPMPGAINGFECTCGGTDHFTSYVSGTGVVNVLIAAALNDAKHFRSSELFRLAAQRFDKSTFDQRLALIDRHAVQTNAASLIDPDVWRCMHDRHAEITPFEQQRWVLPALLDAGMFIDAINQNDAYALQLLDQISAPLATYLEGFVLDDVNVIALSGGFARALGEQYRTRIAPSRSMLNIQWAETDDLDDLRNARSLLWPSAEQIIDLREGSVV